MLNNKVVKKLPSKTSSLETWQKEVKTVVDQLHKEANEKDSTIRLMQAKIIELEKAAAGKSGTRFNEQTLIKTLEDKISSLEQTVKSKNDTLRSLQRKIVSVSPKKSEAKSTLSVGSSDHELSRLKAQYKPTEIEEIDENRPPSAVILKSPLLDVTANRFGISAETFTQRKVAKSIVAKSKTEREEIRRGLLGNLFLSGLDTNQVTQLIDCMSSKRFAKGSDVIRYGEYGDTMYVIKSGEIEVYLMKKGKRHHVTLLRKGALFGELALLYNCKRTASCSTTADTELWCIDRHNFQAIVKLTGEERRNEYLRLLQTVDKLKSMPVGTLMRIADCLEHTTMSRGDYVIRQGEAGDVFYVIQDGKVKVTKGSGIEQEFIVSMGKGEYFGERALLTEDKRSANVIVESETVELLMLDRKDFISFVGNLTELEKAEDISTVVETPTKPEADTASQESAAYLDEIMRTPLNKLQVLGVLGQGGFGCVKLVKIPKITKKAFALKSIKKAKIVKLGQQEHVIAERQIMLSLKSPFTGKLYRTYKDDTRIYMLMDVYLGGELYGVLRKVGPLKDEPARFCAACTIEALAYLHEQNIVYRDLKPENLMLDHRGYVILVDYGFAKQILKNQRTWTFCGTPEYFPPEILNNSGHDVSADYWSLGILIYELLTTSTPFYAQDDMMIYEKILNGVEGVRFSSKVKKNAEVCVMTS